MIQRTIPTWQAPDWRDELKNLIQDPKQLWKALDLDPSKLPAAHAAHKQFQLKVTPSFLSRMKRGDINDPLLKQVMPLDDELQSHLGFVADPLEEARFNPVPGLVHKYTNRVLLIDTTSCAINCRYCFRREFDYSSNRLSSADWEHIFAYIEDDKNIDEVIFSGGDPLLQGDRHFQWVLDRLDAISHVVRVRVHSRIPIVLPSRVTDALISIFKDSRFQVIWVIHSNHPQEIDLDVKGVFRKLKAAGISLFNQAVLLKSINDSAEVQIALAQTLFEHGVQPYYLHALDKVSGTAHFDTEMNLIEQIYETMRSKLPGYMLPKLVRELPGANAKTPLL
jgi:EF-P beta-lysylation protein EpmB